LDEGQAQVADQQTANVVDLALPVEHVIGAGQHAAGHQGDGQEEHGQQQSQRVQREADVLAIALGHVVDAVPGRARENRPRARFLGVFQHALQTVFPGLERAAVGGAQLSAGGPRAADGPVRLVDATRQYVRVVLAPRKSGSDVFGKVGGVVPAGKLAAAVRLAVHGRRAATLFRLVRLVGQAQQRAGPVQAVQARVHGQALGPVLGQQRAVEKRNEPRRVLGRRGGQERGWPARRPFVH